jgi:hypothetical protein
MATKSAIDTQKVLTNIDKTLQELREGVQPEKLSQQDKSSILAQLDKLETAALEAKKAIENG